MSEWQPIETAPKDGSIIRLAWQDRHEEWYTADAFFRNNQWIASCIFYDMNEEFSPQYRFRQAVVKESPTHWMPLPKAPEC